MLFACYIKKVFAMMAEEEGGYDGNFITEVPDDLKCVVCHFVLKEPIQLINCGHRFCKVCYERMKKYSTQWGAELCCPLDRKPLDINQAQINDKAAARVILSFQVRCHHHEEGCNWINDLRSLQCHLEEDCGYVKVPCSKPSCELEIERRMLTDHMKECSLDDKEKNCVIDATSFQRICQRLEICERGVLEKDKEIKDIRHQLQKNTTEIKTLKDSVQTLINLNPAMAVFEWKVENYNQISQLTEPYFSPTFYTSHNGYCCQLSLHWFGPKRGRLGVTFFICPGRNDGQLHVPFNMMPIVQSVGQNGKLRIVTFGIDGERSCFSVSPGEPRSPGLWEYDFLSMPELKKYIIDDSIYLACYILPRNVTVDEDC